MINFETMNRNLMEAEIIISSKYHFSFPDFSRDDIGPQDIMTSILQARVITEGICRYIVLQEHIVKDEKSIRTATLKVYVDDLLRPNLIVPKPVISNFSIIQGISNLTVHFQVDGHLSIKEAYICLESLESVLEWFVKQYRPGEAKSNKWKISSDMLNKSGAIPPKADGCMISRKKEVGEIRDIIIDRKMIMLRGYTGIGKTELAKDYVKKYYKKYDGIYYAENIDEIDDFLYNLPIGILDEEQKTQEEIINEKLDVVHSMELSYLFIIDNYTGKKEEIYRLYPDSDDRYHLMVLVSEDYDEGDEKDYYEVNAFSPEDSLKIFQFFCDTNYEYDEVMSLLSYLSYNPRAIKMSAVFLGDNASYSPYGLIDSMEKNSSIQSIMQNLYTVLTELSILEKDENIRIVSECLSLLPYSGVSKDRFITLLHEAIKAKKEKSDILGTLEKLENTGWISVDNMGFITMNPLLSDTIFEKTNPDMMSDIIVGFISPILKPIREIRELYLSQIIALEPFVDHLAKRLVNVDKCDLTILNDIREYYIAVYNVPQIEAITKVMEQEFSKYKNQNSNIIENAIYRQGISRFNLEDFNEAHSSFTRALEMLDSKKASIEKMIARISAYEGSASAALGDSERGIQSAKRSIEIRERLGKSGDNDEERALWISHYNYAKVLLELGQYEDANQEIDLAISIYERYYPEEYKEWKSTNVSSLFQLKGRILSGMGKYDKAIELLENAKEIREKLKGETYFSTAQVYSYLMSVYSDLGDYTHALQYAEAYYKVLVMQHKTDDIKTKIRTVEKRITFYRKRLDNE